MPNRKTGKHQQRLNQLGTVAEKIFDGTSSASQTVTGIVLQEARASFCRQQIEDAGIELRSRKRKTPAEVQGLKDSLAFHTKELKKAEQEIKELKAHHENRN